jgi:DNA-binding FrmR family transcriptional regulator
MTAAIGHHPQTGHSTRREAKTVVARYLQIPIGVYTGPVMEIPEDVIEDVRRRLHRISGQLGGIERMLDDGRECKDVVTQISAATRALEQAGFKLVAAGLTYCLAHPDEAEAAGYPLDVVEKMFLKLA